MNELLKQFEALTEQEQAEVLQFVADLKAGTVTEQYKEFKKWQKQRISQQTQAK